MFCLLLNLLRYHFLLVSYELIASCHVFLSSILVCFEWSFYKNTTYTFVYDHFRTIFFMLYSERCFDRRRKKMKGVKIGQCWHEVFYSSMHFTPSNVVNLMHDHLDNAWWSSRRNALLKSQIVRSTSLFLHLWSLGACLAHPLKSFPLSLAARAFGRLALKRESNCGRIWALGGAIGTERRFCKCFPASPE